MGRINRIVIVTQDYFPTTGGITTWCDELAVNLRKLGPELTIITKSFDGYDGRERTDIPVIRLNHKRWKNNKYKLILGAARPYSAPDTAFLCANWKMAVPFKTLSLFGRQNVFTAVHGMDALEGRFINRIIQKQALKNSRAVIAVSSYTKKLLTEMNTVPEFMINVINNGVDTKKFFHTGPNDNIVKKYGLHDGPRLLSLGRLVKRKGFDMTIRAMKHIKTRELKYYIAGTGKFEKDLKKLVKKEGLESKVIFLGFIPDQDINGLYNSVDLLSMPSRRLPLDVEGFGITYLEAAACGIPSVAGKDSGAVDAVLDGETGLLVNPESPEEIAAAIDRLFSDAESRRAMGEKAMVRVQSEFTWEMISSQVYNLMEEFSG